jgi:hypothetical protein
MNWQISRNKERWDEGLHEQRRQDQITEIKDFGGKTTPWPDALESLKQSRSQETRNRSPWVARCPALDQETRGSEAKHENPIEQDEIDQPMSWKFGSGLHSGAGTEEIKSGKIQITKTGWAGDWTEKLRIVALSGGLASRKIKAHTAGRSQIHEAWSRARTTRARTSAAKTKPGHA